jgi:hypothetical protein
MKNYLLFCSISLLVAACLGMNKKMVSRPVEFLPGKRLGELDITKVEEASGLAASIKNPGYYWIHNDSGNKAEVFLIDEKAKIVLTCTLIGIENRDWEDITVGSGPKQGKSYVYVGDIGDNNAANQYKYIYRFEEPLLAETGGSLEITKIDKIVFKLSDAQKDSEALFINPKTNDLYLLSKREKPVHLYQLKYPFSTMDTLTATSVLTLPLTQVTAGDISSDGSEILLKDYLNIFYWKVKEGKNLEETLKEEPKILHYKPEPQGEAIAWANDSSGFYTVSEKGIAKKSFLYFYKRK